MFSKSFIVLAILALFACQGTTATQLTETEKASLADLIKQLNQIISGLNNLVSGVLGDALGTLTNLVSTIAEIKKKFLDEGLELISGGIKDVVSFIANKTAEAAELGIDITKCLLGTNQTLADLSIGLTKNLTGCVTDTVSIVLDLVNKEIANINAVIKTILAAPLKLSKCLISLRPISCVTKLIGDLGTMLATLPGQIVQVVQDAVDLVANLPQQLGGCIANIASSVAAQTQALMSEIGTCVDNLISQSTTTANEVTPTTAAGTEVTPTTAAGTDATTVAGPRASLGELIDQIKEIISNLEGLVGGVIGDAVGVLKGLVQTIAEIKKKYLDDGLALISEEISNVADFIKNKTEQALDLGVDITVCVVGRKEQLEALSTGLVLNLTDCITTAVGHVLTMVNSDIAVVNKLVSQVTGAPVKLAKCLISLRPISCVTNLLSDLTNLVASIPGLIADIIANNVKLVEDLPTDLGACIANIAVATTTQTAQIVKEIGDCVDNVIAG